MYPFVTPIDTSGIDQPLDESTDTLKTGFVALGNANKLTGSARYDTSAGTSYGNGERYEHEETVYMTKTHKARD